MKPPISKEVPTMPDTGTLTKAKIINTVAESNRFTRQKSIETVETLLELIKKSLESGEDVMISGFGKFCVKQKAKRKGRNPATGEDLILAPRKVVTFKWSGMLKEKLNPKKPPAKISPTRNTKKVVLQKPKTQLKEAQMAKKKDRDIEKAYSTKQMVAKLRRLADCLENGKQYKIQIAGERISIPAKAIFNIEHEREGNTEEVEFQFKWER
jgi:integration host factor subunit alpha